MKNLFIFLVTCFLLTGCISENLPPEPPVDDPASTKVAEASVAVSSSLQTLEGIRKAEMPFYTKQLPDPRYFGMDYLTSIEWTGPVGPLVEQIAMAGDYHLRVLGSPPEIPIIIQLNEKNIPLAVILRDVDFQAGTKAHVVVYPARRVIELRYLGFDCDLSCARG